MFKTNVVLNGGEVKKKKKGEKFSKILDDIPSDIIAEFLEVTTLLPAHVAVLPGERRVIWRDFKRSLHNVI
jgi:hypothetical protein